MNQLQKVVEVRPISEREAEEIARGFEAIE